jgi:lipopolysaccharide/colanic/teichoic acid biosynthesis glycosyltransferase
MLLKIATESSSSDCSSDLILQTRQVEMSPWTASGAKRFFDVAVVLASTPVVLPLLILIACAVRATTNGPVLFQQMRIGRFGEPFTIYKFRTMRQKPAGHGDSIAAISTDRITPLGQVLRWFKLDELPQVLNVLAGQMSLVGPRPLIPEQQLALPQCRPGITGLATLTFAREESLLAPIPKEILPEYYRKIILPAKQHLDASYMKHATLLSDLKLIFDTVFRCWGVYEPEALIRQAQRFSIPRPSSNCQQLEFSERSASRTS